MNVGLMILRVVVGALFVGHGTQKLFGWFGGRGLDGAAGFMQSLRYRNGRVAAALAGSTETLSGLLLILGLLTPLAAAGIIGVMVNAIATVHLRNGLWNEDRGMELPLVYSTVAAALGFTGPGALSLDRLFELDLAGPTYGLGAIVVGLAAALIVLALGRAASESEARSERSRNEQLAA
jgi:putative oxidoreductase